MKCAVQGFGYEGLGIRVFVWRIRDLGIKGLGAFGILHVIDLNNLQNAKTNQNFKCEKKVNLKSYTKFQSQLPHTKHNTKNQQSQKYKNYIKKKKIIP